MPPTCTAARAGRHVLIGRHELDCPAQWDTTCPCPGCAPCPHPLCRACTRVHADGICPTCLASLRDDLDEITTLWPSLPEQATDGTAPNGRPLHSAPILGGDATVLLGPATRDRNHEHPAQVLAWWVDKWRDWFGQLSGLEANLYADAAWLDRNLHRIATTGPDHRGHPPEYLEMASDVRRARRRVEDVLRAGDRPEVTPVPCLDCGARLHRLYNHAAVCPRPSCRRTYTPAEYALAKAQLLYEADTADRYVPVALAVEVTGRSEYTIRSWARRLQIRSVCDLTTHRLLVWWPDVRHRHTRRAQP